jgi:hypothetical protein
MPALRLIALLTPLLSGCAGGPPGSTMTMTGCMDPQQADASDLRRNRSQIRGTPLCYRLQRLHEGPFHWTFHLLEHRQHPNGPFWVLPHDDENTAFDVAVQAVIDYGGGLLAIDSSGRRHFHGQDPNRNFSRTRAEANRCSGQRKPAPGYVAAVLDHYRGRQGPILALHNNQDGWGGNGGRGSISLHRPIPAHERYPGHGSGLLRDEDNLIFMAGRRPLRADTRMRREIARLNAAGLNVVYKQVGQRNFDCSLSDYVALHRLGDYFNIEAQHGAHDAQQQMVERLLEAIGIAPLDAAPSSPFLEPPS